VPTAGPILGEAETPIAVTTTDSLGNEVILSGVTSGAVITTTDARGHTLTTTYHPTGKAVRSIVLETIILPNGQQSVITSFAIIVPTGFGAVTQQQAATPTVTARLGLQSAAAPTRKFRGQLAMAVGGAAGIACLL